jgi:biopolymer transport protein ExbD
MSMQTTSDNASGEPMVDMNITPLIDVLLVLIIMLIITIPPQTHAVKLDLPVNDPRNIPPPIQALKNTVGVSASYQITWNVTPISQDQLRSYLEVTQQMNPIPELHLQPDATARYELVDEVLAITKKAHVQKMGFVGNEYYQNIF